MPPSPRLRRLVLYAAALLGAAAGVVLISLNQGEPTRIDTKPAHSAAQLRGIGQALLLYADNAGGTLPGPEEDWVADLIESGFTPAEMFVTPDAIELDVISYFYVPSDHITWEATTVLAYEMPGLRDAGAYILYHDLHLEFVPPSEAARIIASLTLPDGTSWQPHLHPRKAP